MKKASHALLKTEIILDAISIGVTIILTLVFLGLGIPFMIQNAGLETEEAIALFTSGTACLTTGIVLFFLIPVPIISMELAKVAIGDLEKAQNKDEARQGAILAIVAGALGSKFSIASGVMMLCMKDSHYEH